MLALTAFTYEARPKEADPSTGRTIPFNVHGTDIYLTRDEQKIHHRVRVGH